MPPRRSACSSELGATLVAAYLGLASAQWSPGAPAETIAAAERALSLAERQGLAVPARALGFRGLARAYLGDADGLAEAEQALALMIEQGACRDAAVLQNNLAIARYPLQGPARSLAAFEEGIAFSEERGLAEVAAVLEGNCPGLLVELGRVEEALVRAVRLAVQLEASGDAFTRSDLRAVELATRLAQGKCEPSPAAADWLIETARASGLAEMSVLALGTAAAARLAAAEPEQARALLRELEQTPSAQQTPYYARQLPAMVRTALAAGDPTLARTLTNTLEPLFPCTSTPLQAPRPSWPKQSASTPGRNHLRRSRRTLGAVREHPRARPRPPRSGPLPAHPRRPRRQGTAPPGDRAVHLDGLLPRPRRERSAHRADDRAGLLAAPPHSVTGSKSNIRLLSAERSLARVERNPVFTGTALAVHSGASTANWRFRN